MRRFYKITSIFLVILLSLTGLSATQVLAQNNIKPRILISSDIGGTDDDDFQSAVHLLMYANLFQIEGLVSSPFGKGTKKDFLKIIDLYEKDLPKLKKQAEGFPDPINLRDICKQGAKEIAPFKGFNQSTEGSNWIIQKANKKNMLPLYILVWGGLEDLAQALHDDPGIKKNIRVYWIGGPNKKWSANAYAYIAQNFPDLWMIECNATYRGLIIDAEATKDFKAATYFENVIKGHGEMGKAFANWYNGRPKMGDTPSLGYLMKGDPNYPTGESWGGSFVSINRSSRKIFNRNTTISDTIPAYGMVEWRFKGPIKNTNDTVVCFTMKIGGQIFPGYYLGGGNYGIRYVSKAPEVCKYIIWSEIPALNNQKGEFVSIISFPGKPNNDDFKLGKYWYGDRLSPEFFLGEQQGARTIAKYREAFLADWGKRWKWLE